MFAIFYKNRQGDLIHIASNSYITPSNKASMVCNYFASELQPFEEVYGDGMPFLGLNSKSKISRGFIQGLENDGNKHSTKQQTNLGV